jgi:transposase
MTNYKEILRLNSLRINNSQIAVSCSCSRTTVISVLQKAKEADITWQSAVEMSDKELSKRLFPTEAVKSAYKMPDYEYVHHEMSKSGVTLSLLWVEYCEECRKNGDIPYKSTQFNKYYSEFVQKTKATMHINRKPGELMEVDWAGATATIIDTDTGEVIDANVFVAALPYSGYAYVEAFLSQNQENWIAAHVNAYRHFGGATRILVPDNLKTGVDKVTKSETIINKAYGEMAQHYGTAVIPARVRKPKDKATVEGSVGIISTWILAAIRNRQFLSLNELNEAIKEKLHNFNNKPFQKKSGSRAVLFESEKPFLLPLPAHPYELSTWKIATVPPNYHIFADNQNYSVPFEYIGQKVDIRLTRNTIEVFFEGNRICSHKREFRQFGQYITNNSHMPPGHREYISWNSEKFTNEAAKVGGNTEIVVNIFLTNAKEEKQGYKNCLSLLRLADKYSPEQLESACAKALSYTPSPSIKTIQAVLKSNLINAEEKTPSASKALGLTRGAEYYRREK